MDEELLELQRQFECAQQAKSSVRLSERNVVELVQKLHQLEIIDFDLLHTVTGKEYITPEQLKNEILAEMNKLGRVSLIDLADITGVDLYHVEKQAQDVVSNDTTLMLINGEIISDSYWDTAAEEINERLQECSQIALAEIATQLQVGSELLVTILEPRLGTLVKARLEGGQLYTPAYVERVNAMVRGASRGICLPMNLLALWNTLQSLLQEMNGASGIAVESSFFQSLFNGVVKDGEILGSLRAGVQWTPLVFATAQKECVDALFSQGSFIGYDALNKLGIAQPLQFLQSRYPGGIPLDTVFAHPSIVEMLDAAMEDAIERVSWIDALSVLPLSFASQDASKILSLCPSVQTAIKSNKAVVFGESYVFSSGFVKNLYDRLEKEMDTLNVSSFALTGPTDDQNTARDESSNLSDSNDAGNDSTSSKQVSDKITRKKKGKSAGGAKMTSVESGSDYQENVPSKYKKNQKKGKNAHSLQDRDSKSVSKRENDGSKGDSSSIISEEWLLKKMLLLIPDIEEQGMDDPETILLPLANHIRPMLLNTLRERKKAAFTENSQKIKRLLDNIQRRLDESSLNIQLYEKALDLLEDDQSTLVLLHKHLLRTTATPMVDFLLLSMDMLNKLKNGIEVDESQNVESILLGSAERVGLAKSFQGPLSTKAIALVEALEGKRVETFMTALKAMTEESGLILKKLDKKLERTLLHSYRKDLTAQVTAETDPVSLLPKVVSLLYVQIYGKALQAPGRAISVAVSHLKEKLDESAFKTLTDYHSATVTLLSLMSASTGDEKDCTSDRTSTKRDLLETLMPALKGLVLGTQQS